MEDSKRKLLFDKIDSLYETYLSVWEDICNIESPTSFKEGVDAVGAYFSNMAKERDWKVDIFPHDVSGNVVCITMNPNADAAPLCLSGHMDTVHPVGSFGNPAVHFGDGKIYGPGVVDCKGGIVAGFLAMDALDKCGFRHRPVKLLLQSDEEVGSSYSKKATINYICDQAEGAVGFLNLEGTNTGKVCFARKGIINYTFKVKGEEAHSSKCANEGSNAIIEAAHKMLEIDKIKNDDGITCNCAVISGGSVPNTVPGYCEFKVNIRFSTTEELEWVKERMRQIADTTYINGCSCEIVQTSFRVPMEICDKNLRLLERIGDILSDNGLERLEGNKRNGGSDAADVTARGIPCIDNMGVYGGKVHSPDEYAICDSLKTIAKRIALVAYDI